MPQGLRWGGPSRLVEGHGSFTGQWCINCHATYPVDKMKEGILAGSVLQCKAITGLVQLDIVLFGESLRRGFLAVPRMVAEEHLVAVMWGLLSVCPFPELPGWAKEGVLRF
ncbi:hypothetical protein HOY80DRAFT_191256 [Tuber brumale]|nr:hypothetical protein HOY80DRAFT_191256 [Tuber brumale]